MFLNTLSFVELNEFRIKYFNKNIRGENVSVWGICAHNSGGTADIDVIECLITNMHGSGLLIPRKKSLQSKLLLFLIRMFLKEVYHVLPGFLEPQCRKHEYSGGGGSIELKL